MSSNSPKAITLNKIKQLLNGKKIGMMLPVPITITNVAELSGKENVLIVKFKNAKVANDFVNYVISQYPNSFHLNNEWEASKSSETMISFTSMQGSQRSLLSLSETIASLFADSITISNLTKSKVVGIQVSADEDMCYLTFSINFKSSNDVEQFLIDFHRFKA